MNEDLAIPLDRVTWRDGQLLASRDLTDDVRRDARLRGLHTRFLHDTWGIALGFEVKTANGQTSIVVGPGCAVDILGRDILLAEGVDIPVPALQGPAQAVLVASYLDDAAFRPASDLASLCFGGGLDPRRERPSFAWRAPDDIRPGPEIPLVAVQIHQGAVFGNPELRVRRYARRLLRPHIGFGLTEPGRTLWTGDDRAALITKVDTSEAGFTRTPYYFALLRLDARAPATGSLVSFQSPVGFVRETGRNGFTYGVLRGAELPMMSNQALDAYLPQRAGIVWLGIEPVAGCEPKLDFRRIFLLSGILRSFLAEVIA